MSCWSQEEAFPLPTRNLVSPCVLYLLGNIRAHKLLWTLPLAGLVTVPTSLPPLSVCFSHAPWLPGRSGKTASREYSKMAESAADTASGDLKLWLALVGLQSGSANVWSAYHPSASEHPLLIFSFCGKGPDCAELPEFVVPGCWDLHCTCGTKELK